MSNDLQFYYTGEDLPYLYKVIGEESLERFRFWTMSQPKEKINEIDEHITKRFDVQKRLGKGAYGIVWKAVDKRTKEVVAVKKIFDAFRNQTDAQRTFREIMFLQAFKHHPNIIKLHSIHR